MDRDLARDIDAARRGDPKAFETLFARNLPPLIAFIRARAGRAMLARESASDLAQSVCREAIADLDDFEFKGEDAFRNWLFLQATRKVLDRARHHSRGKRDASREVAMPAEEGEAEALLACYASLATPSQHAAAREELARFEAAVQKLPEAQREAVTMSRLMNLSYAQIAEHLGTTEAAVRGLVARGLAVLAAALDQG